MQPKANGKRKSDDTENEDPCSPPTGSSQNSIVGSHIIQSVLNELRSHKHAPSRLSSKRTRVESSESDELTTGASNSNEPTDLPALKKVSSNPVIDVCSIGNKTSSPVNHTTEPHQPIASQFTPVHNLTPDQHSTNDYYNSSSNSFSAISSSSEESETSSSYSSNQMKFPLSLPVMHQPLTIQDYVHKKYYQQRYYNAEQRVWTQAANSIRYDQVDSSAHPTSITAQIPSANTYATHSSNYPTYASCSQSTYILPDNNVVQASFPGNLYHYRT
jgi:hypothetical protein